MIKMPPNNFRAAALRALGPGRLHNTPWYRHASAPLLRTLSGSSKHFSPDRKELVDELRMAKLELAESERYANRARYLASAVVSKVTNTFEKLFRSKPEPKYPFYSAADAHLRAVIALRDGSPEKIARLRASVTRKQREVEDEARGRRLNEADPRPRTETLSHDEAGSQRRMETMRNVRRPISRYWDSEVRQTPTVRKREYSTHHKSPSNAEDDSSGDTNSGAGLTRPKDSIGDTITTERLPVELQSLLTKAALFGPHDDIDDDSIDELVLGIESRIAQSADGIYTLLASSIRELRAELACKERELMKKEVVNKIDRKLVVQLKALALSLHDAALAYDEFVTGLKQRVSLYEANEAKSKAAQSDFEETQLKRWVIEQMQLQRRGANACWPPSGPKPTNRKQEYHTSAYQTCRPRRRHTPLLGLRALSGSSIHFMGDWGSGRSDYRMGDWDIPAVRSEDSDTLERGHDSSNGTSAVTNEMYQAQAQVIQSLRAQLADKELNPEPTTNKPKYFAFYESPYKTENDSANGTITVTRASASKVLAEAFQELRTLLADKEREMINKKGIDTDLVVQLRAFAMCLHDAARPYELFARDLEHFHALPVKYKEESKATEPERTKKVGARVEYKASTAEEREEEDKIIEAQQVKWVDDGSNSEDMQRKRWVKAVLNRPFPKSSGD